MGVSQSCVITSIKVDKWELLDALKFSPGRNEKPGNEREATGKIRKRIDKTRDSDRKGREKQR